MFLPSVSYAIHGMVYRLPAGKGEGIIMKNLFHSTCVWTVSVFFPPPPSSPLLSSQSYQSAVDRKHRNSEEARFRSCCPSFEHVFFFLEKNTGSPGGVCGGVGWWIYVYSDYFLLQRRRLGSCVSNVLHRRNVPSGSHPLPSGGGGECSFVTFDRP